MRSLATLFLLAPALLSQQISAQQTIEYSPTNRTWLLRTDSSAYALGVNPRGELVNLYWGGPLWRAADVPPATNGRELSSFDPAQSLLNEEYVGWGGTRYLEPSIKITRADQGRDLVLHYASHSIDGDNLRIVLKDVKDDIFVSLNYKVFPREGIIRKSALLENRSKEALNVESLQAGVWYVPHGAGYRLSYVSGRWAAESQLSREPIHSGIKVLESKKGHTSHNFNPWFAIDDGSATEESGLERQLAHLGRADGLRSGACYRRSEYVRFRLSAEARGIAGIASVLWRVFDGRLRRDVAPHASFRTDRYSAARFAGSSPAGALQFVGSDHLQGGRSRAAGPGGKGGEARRRIIRDG
jgi:hypothetical protein